jgi:hypothetical protein
VVRTLRRLVAPAAVKGLVACGRNALHLYTFFKFSPSDLMPPYWINIGAMAISTLAGTLLIANAAASPLLQKLQPFLLGLTILFWATATW